MGVMLSCCLIPHVVVIFDLIGLAVYPCSVKGWERPHMYIVSVANHPHAARHRHLHSHQLKMIELFSNHLTAILSNTWPLSWRFL
ncbi:hypothetical protein V8C40DRAFT_256929 [Trichoderma camerunense]